MVVSLHAQALQQRVAAGGSALDPQVVSDLVASTSNGDPLAELTAREREVLALMAEGLTNVAIAKRLWLPSGLSRPTCATSS